MNGYNFTNSVRRALVGAREEAAALSHEYVGTEHILLAILSVEGTIALAVLETLGVNPDVVREEIISVVKRGTASRAGPDLPYTSRAKKTLELAMSQARALEMNYVDTEHLLLGLIAEEKGIAAQVLADHGVTLDAALAEARRVLATSAASGAPLHVEPVVRRRPPSAAANERLRTVMHSAFQIANAAGCRTVGASHCAIALLDHGEGVANTAFTRLALDAARVREAVVALPSGASEPITPEEVLQLDQRLMAAMERERSAAHAPSLSTAHLALALLGDDSDVAPCFVAAGVTRANLSAELARISG